MAENGNWLVEVKPWYGGGMTTITPDITKYMVTTSKIGLLTSAMRAQ